MAKTTKTKAEKPKKKLKKYNITDVATGKLLGERLTKKATSEWLETKIKELNEREALTFAADVYGEGIKTLGVDPITIVHINKVAGFERLPKLLKKELRLKNLTVKVTLWEEPKE